MSDRSRSRMAGAQIAGGPTPKAAPPRPQSAFPAKAPYDPLYDPLVSDGPGRNCDYAPTYWMATAGQAPDDDGPVTADMDVDVAVIGSGYTGVSCALHLARDHGLQTVVLEANSAAWGCSTRNGGQAQISVGRLKRGQWVSRYGLEVARALHGELEEAFEVFRDLVAASGSDCDLHEGGHLNVAHKPAALARATAECEVLNRHFGYPARILSREELHADYVKEEEAHGALYEPDGASVHAAKLAFAYIRMARQHGAAIHPGSPVTQISRHGGAYHLHTPGGTVRARAVALATSGYTPAGLAQETRHRLMPILSNSLVTRPLTAGELEACGFQTHAPITDTRTLRHYYRLLPDNRVQIGSRSAVTGRDAENPKHLALLLKGLYRKFPALTGIELDYSWWGWVDVSHDMMPRIFQPDPQHALFYAMGYGGNGVMYSAQAGRRMAQMVAGKGGNLTLPIFTSPLPHHGMLTPFRRLGQRMLYPFYHLRDERL